MSGWNEQIIKEFRENNGAVGGMFEGAPLVLLTTAGRRTGRPHTTPAVHLRDGERYLVFASNAGGPRHPHWYLNLLASPQVTVETAGEHGSVRKLAAQAVPLEGEERDHWWERQCQVDPGFREYEAKTDRTIPVVALHPLVLSPGDDRARLIGQQLLQAHDLLRGQLRDVRERFAQLAAGERPGAAPAPGAAEQLRAHCLTFCHGLHLHHIREDGAFTAFEERFPDLVPVITRLRAEHAVIERALERLADLLDREPPTGDPAALTALREEVEAAVADLEEHFATEEAHFLPALEGLAAAS
ncbi:nitroreductase/quinone reductase family protein [Streptomyces litchfieldiae]|uniref:Nitroreductase/quinone reductase family protein n=1 Tax=Streptomyces litchfieldiae TaxID=3075543 RepID=A0ABU2N2K5_9ACTN|nr:nitroreductase/quinone reductase family protein [Streptomyces sp. DSM 44938]MDT0347758.1 nitroreductase/quinone reductase family protein [Streptomyces sp. DSM 44938]